MNDGVFSNLGSELDTLLSNFSSNAADFLIGTLLAPIEICIAIYFLYKGYMMTIGKGEGLVEDLLVSFAKIGFIVAIALSTPWYTTHVIDVVNGFQEWMMEVTTSWSPDRANNQWEALDIYWITVMEGFSSVWGVTSEYGLREVGLLLASLAMAIVTAIAGISFTLAAVGVFLINKVGLVIALAFGPFFLCCLMFPVTKGWFDSWLKTVLTLVFTTVVATAILMIFASILDNSCLKIKAAIDNSIPLKELWIPILVYTILSFAGSSLMSQAPSLASSMTGGVGLAAVSMGTMFKNAANSAAKTAGAGMLAAGLASGKSDLAERGKNLMRFGMAAPGKSSSSSNSQSSQSPAARRSRQMLMDAIKRMENEGK